MLKLFFAAVLAVFGFGAHAATFNHYSTTNGQFITAPLNGTVQSDVYSFTFEWSDLTAPDYAIVGFTADDDFDLFLTGYSDLGDQAAVSAFALNYTAPGDIFGSRVPGTTDNCSVLVRDCFPVSNTTATSGALGLLEIAAQPSSTDPALDGLSAGQYFFYFGESATPASGFATFELRTAAVSEVPLPAAGWLLLFGLGGLAAIKRRAA